MEEDIEKFGKLIKKLKPYKVVRVDTSGHSISIVNNSEYPLSAIIDIPSNLNLHLCIHRNDEFYRLHINGEIALKEAYRNLKKTGTFDELRSTIQLELLAQM